MAAILQQIIGNDNDARKTAEAQLQDAKRAEADKYATYLIAIVHPSHGASFSPEVKSLAAVILRRNVSIMQIDSGDVKDAANNANLWDRLTDQAREFLKISIVETLQN